MNSIWYYWKGRFLFFMRLFLQNIFKRNRNLFCSIAIYNSVRVPRYSLSYSVSKFLLGTVQANDKYSFQRIPCSSLDAHLITDPYSLDSTLTRWWTGGDVREHNDGSNCFHFEQNGKRNLERLIRQLPGLRYFIAVPMSAHNFRPSSASTW